MRKPANDNISYFGGCPTCGGNDGCMTDSARDHWYYCLTHRAKWCIGGNLFSNSHMSQQEFLANDHRLQHFHVEPLPPLPTRRPAALRLNAPDARTNVET